MSNDRVHPDIAIILDGFKTGASGGYRLPPGQCVYCDRYRDDSMIPPHTPSKNCESGKRPHCTCDLCF